MDSEKCVAFSQAMFEYKRQLAKGVIKEAYNGLMSYMGHLRSYFEHKYPAIPVSGNVYYGFMDMTYFALFPASLRNRKLKVAVVFLHEQFRFEVWLAGVNKAVQNRYWRLFEESNWKKYTLPQQTRATDSILEHVLADNPDFGDLEALTKQIEDGTLEFIKEVTSYLASN